MSATEVRAVMFPSRSSTKVYVAKVWSDGTVTCNCPAWVFKKGDTRSCCHTRAVEDDAPLSIVRNATSRGPKKPRISVVEAPPEPEFVSGRRRIVLDDD